MVVRRIDQMKLWAAYELTGEAVQAGDVDNGGNGADEAEGQDMAFVSSSIKWARSVSHTLVSRLSGMMTHWRNAFSYGLHRMHKIAATPKETPGSWVSACYGWAQTLPWISVLEPAVHSLPIAISPPFTVAMDRDRQHQFHGQDCDKSSEICSLRGGHPSIERLT